MLNKTIVSTHSPSKVIYKKFQKKVQYLENLGLGRPDFCLARSVLSHGEKTGLYSPYALLKLVLISPVVAFTFAASRMVDIKSTVLS